jgi:hypothetical protein
MDNEIDDNAEVIFASENGMVFASGDSFVGDEDAFADDLARELARRVAAEKERAAPRSSEPTQLDRSFTGWSNDEIREVEG